ncbi:MAG: hypothetical protein WDN46_15260 [Methylocella sp.]
MDELEELYDAGQIAKGSEKYSDLIALQQLHCILLQFEQLLYSDDSDKPSNSVQMSRMAN